MSGLRVNTLRGASTGTSPTFPDGVIVSGVTTSTSFSGNVTGNVTGNVVGNVTGDVTGNVTGTTGTFTGNVSVGGTLTYDDVTNVDSVGVITARSGIRIGAGQSVSAVSGIVTYYGDGSQLTGVTAGGESNFVASGTIANGATVIIKTDGTVSAVTQTGSANPSVGTKVTYTTGTSNYIVSTYDSNSNKIVIAYSDGADSHAGKAIVGTVSGTSISFGSIVQFEGGQCNYLAATFDSNSNKVVIAFRDVSDSDKAKAIVGTVSGTSISFGTPVVITTNNCAHFGATFDSNSNKVVITYRDGTNSAYGKAVVGTVSGTSISFGSIVTFNTSDTRWMRGSVVFDSTNNKVVISYQDDGDSAKGKAIVGTVSGTSISFGSAVLFENDSTGSQLSAAFDSTNGKVVISYPDSGDSETGKTVVGTVSGTSITFGTHVEFTGGGGVSYPSSTYDSTNGKIIVAYRDESNNHGKVVVGTVSGTSISFGSPTTFQSSNSYYITAAFDSSNDKVVISYNDNDDSNNGASIVFTPNNSVTNLTTENYIGIAAEAIANGATGKVNILGGVNSGQTGLTTAKTYYVQPTGTLATSAGSPSVVAGTSISNTKILIR
jgi:hypothetical protein